MFDNTLEDKEMTLGRRIKELRNNKNLTQEELAQKLNTNRPTLSNWELDRTQPGYTMLKKVADFFEVSTDYLLNGTSADLLPGGKVAIYVENDKLVDISELPSEIRQQVLDYIKFIKMQYINKK